MKDMESNTTFLSPKANRIFERFLNFYTDSWANQYLILGIIIALAFTYAVLMDIWLGRPTTRVTIEIIILVVSLLLSLPLLDSDRALKPASSDEATSTLRPKPFITVVYGCLVVLPLILMFALWAVIHPLIMIIFTVVAISSFLSIDLRISELVENSNGHSVISRIYQAKDRLRNAYFEMRLTRSEYDGMLEILSALTYNLQSPIDREIEVIEFDDFDQKKFSNIGTLELSEVVTAIIKPLSFMLGPGFTLQFRSESGPKYIKAAREQLQALLAFSVFAAAEASSGHSTITIKVSLVEQPAWILFLRRSSPLPSAINLVVRYRRAKTIIGFFKNKWNYWHEYLFFLTKLHRIEREVVPPQVNLSRQLGIQIWEDHALRGGKISVNVPLTNQEVLGQEDEHPEGALTRPPQ